MKRSHKALIVLASIVLIFFLFLAVVFCVHKIKQHQEKSLIVPTGNLVEVDNHHMSVYTEGTGSNVLVFMSGSGTCSPILDFKPLYSKLSNDFTIVVVEKFGYGFSDNYNSSRDIDTMLSNTREAILKCGIQGPYILCPHSMSGLEALYWAQTYPQEVKAIIGIDMAFPEYYKDMKISKPVFKLMKAGASIGITRLIPSLSQSDAIKSGTLTDSEKAMYKALFFSKTMTQPMINESSCVKQNALKVQANSFPKIPILLFVSDGSGGTGFTKEEWRSVPELYSKNYNNVSAIYYDAPHYLHDYCYNQMSRQIIKFNSMNF